MKIVLSTQPIKYPLTGIGRYTYELAVHLGRISEISDLTYFAGNHFAETLPENSEVASEPSGPQSITDKFKRTLARSQLIVELYRILKSTTDKDLFRGMDDRLFHGTNFYVPKFPGASVVTIHDLSVFTMPQCHPKERLNYLGKEIETSIKRVTMIATDSDFIKREIMDHFDIPGERIGVAKLACGQEFHPRELSEVADTLSSYALEYGSYALYAGTIEPRKNLANLIRAYGKLTQEQRMQTPLALAGYKGWNNQEIMDLIEAGEREGWIKHLGFVPNDDLPLLYSGARLFLFPSHYEGFGLPVLEAMASGVPVITSNRSSLPEVGGDAVLYTEPEDVDGLTELLLRGLEDENWRSEAIVAGIERAKTFSWAKCAAETAEIYKQAIALREAG